MRKSENKPSVHLKVKQLAEQKGLSDLHVASFAQVDVRVVRRMFANEWEHLYLTQLAKVAEALGCHISDLIEEDNKTPDPSTE